MIKGSRGRHSRPNLTLIRGGGESTPPETDSGTDGWIDDSQQAEPYQMGGRVELGAGGNVIPFRSIERGKDQSAPRLGRAVEAMDSAELLDTIKAVREALAEKYNVSSDDFNLVTYRDKEGQTVRVIMYTALDPLDLSNPNDDYDPASSWETVTGGDHTIEIDGKTYDTLKGTTLEAYVAFAKREAEGGRKPKDTAGKKVLLTGEKPRDTLVKAAYIDEDGSAVEWFYVGQNLCQGVVLRPGVIFPFTLPS